MRRFAFCLALVLSFPISLQAQGDAEERKPIFRSGVLTVAVDAVVTDKKNRVVTDLQSGDFEIYEDGVKQTIESFRFFHAGGKSVRAVEAIAGDEPISDSPPFSQGEAGTTPDLGNLIVFLLDYATTEFTNQKLVEEAATRYVKENLKPGDYVAIFVVGAGFYLLQEFTEDKESLIQALQRREISEQGLSSTSGAGQSVTAPASGLESVQIFAASPQAMAAAGQAASAAASDLARVAIAQRIQRLFANIQSAVQEREARSVLTAIEAISQGLTSIPGRKTLFLFSQGFVVGGNMERALEKTISIANRSNVVVYGLDSQGLAAGSLSSSLIPAGELSSISAGDADGNILSGRRIDASGGRSLFDRAKEVGSDLRDSALRYLSTSTGGFAIRNTNDLYTGLRRVDQEIRSYYLFGYQPSNLNFDGRFRNIEVRVRYKDYKVRHRSGYLALPLGMEMLDQQEYQLLRAAENGELQMNLPAELKLGKFSPQVHPKHVLVSLFVPGKEIEFRRQESDQGPHYLSEIQVIGLIRDSTGQVLMRFGSPMTLSFAEEEHRLLLERGMDFNNLLELGPGTYSVQLWVQDSISRKTAFINQSLRLLEPSQELQVSSLVLGKELQRAEAGIELLTVDDTMLVPTADRLFKNGDKLIFYLEIYNPRLKENAFDLSARVSVLRAGSAQPIELPEFEIQSGSGRKVALSRYIDLKGLDPGTYFLEARIEDRNAMQSVSTRTSFSLIE